MKLVNRLIIATILLSANINFAQEFNGYKYIVVGNPDYGVKGKDIYGVGQEVVNYFKKRSFQVIFGWDNRDLYPNELKFNDCIGLYIDVTHKASPPYEVTLNFYNCKKEIVKQLTGKASGSFENALKKIFTQLDENSSYSYDENLTPTIEYPIVENINKDENELKAYFDSTKLTL